MQNRNKFRYTAMQRRVETGSKQFTQMLKQLKHQNGIDRLKSTISSHRTMAIDKFLDYLYSKQRIKTTLQAFYGDSLHNKKKWKIFIRTQKSEAKLIKNMKRIYENFVVVMGDW